MKTLMKGLVAMFLTINTAGAERIGTGQEYLQKEIERWSEAIKETNQDDGIYIAVEQYYKYRADAYQKLGDYENALKDYTRALKLRSDFPEAHHARALVYLSLGNVKKALEDAIKACKWYEGCETYQMLVVIDKQSD